MQISFQPEQVDGTGKIVPVPVELKGLLVPWTDSQCISYDFGTIIRQVLATPDYRIYASVFSIHRPVTLFPSWDAPTIALQYTRQGKILSRLNGSEDVILDPSRYSLFHVAAGKHVLRPQPGLSESLRIEISPDYLQELLVAHPQLQCMLDNLHQHHQTGALLPPVRMNGKVKNIIHDIYQCRKTGPSLYLELKAHIYGLLSAYDDEITLADDLGNLQATKTEKIVIEVKQYIGDFPHIHECSLENLSKRFCISPSALKLHFKKQCHVSIGDYVQQQCILKAQQLLQLGADPIRDIAIQLGYTDVSNFSRAFRNYMGCSPNELRTHPERRRRR